MFSIQRIVTHASYIFPILLFLKKSFGLSPNVWISLLLFLSIFLKFVEVKHSRKKWYGYVASAEKYMCYWSLSPLMLHALLCGDLKYSMIILTLGWFQLTNLWQVNFRSILFYFQVFIHFQLAFILSSFFSVRVAITLLVLISSFVVKFLFHYLSTHEQILVYVSISMVLLDLSTTDHLIYIIPSHETYSWYSYLHIFEVAIFSLCVMMCVIAIISKCYEVIKGSQDKFFVIIGRFVTTINIIIFFSIAFVIPQLQHNLQLNPFQWLLGLFLKDRYFFFYLAIVWILLIIFFILIADWSMNRLKLSKNHGRKIFHFMVLVMFVPGLREESVVHFTALSFGGALCLFLLSEFLRVYVLLGTYHKLNEYFDMFISGDESSKRSHIIVSHMSLLVGCGLSIWVWSINPHLDKIVAYLGLMTLGVGDSLAAIIGSIFGKRKWSKSKKTYLGSFSAWIGMICFYGLCMLLDTTITLNCISKVILTCFCTVIAEVTIEGNDNFILPFFSLVVYLCL